MLLLLGPALPSTAQTPPVGQGHEQPDATQIAAAMLTDYSGTVDLRLCDASGALVTDLTGPGYSGGAGQWLFFGHMPQGASGEFAVTSNAGRGVLAGRGILVAAPRAEMYVDAANGPDANPGTATAPFATIQKGVTEAADGGTVHHAAGTYAETVTVDKGVVLRGAQADVPVANRTAGSGTETVLQGEFNVAASEVTINGFTLTRPGGQRGGFVGDSTPSHSNITFAHNLIVGVGGESYTKRAYPVYLYRGPDQVTISYSLSDDIKATGQSVSAIFVDDSASIDPSEGLVIQGNTFTDVVERTGSYAILINNGAGPEDVEIKDNVIDGGEGQWAQATGLEGPTPDAEVSGNTIANVTDCKSPSDAVGVMFEDNPDGDAVAVHESFFSDMFWGVAIHAQHLDGGDGTRYLYTVDAAPNGWGDADGTGSVYYVPNTTSTGDIIDLIDEASPGSTITLQAGAYTGGLTLNSPGITVKGEDGALIGPGSPAFTVTAADVTIENLVLDGVATDPGILVQSGGDNLAVKDCEITAWADGILVEAGVGSLKVVGNYFRHNGDAGLQVDSGVALSGVVTIEGNLFKANVGNGIQNDSETALKAEYNSWGHLDGPTAGDGVGGHVDVAPWTCVEALLDVQPDDGLLERDAQKVLGLTFRSPMIQTASPGTTTPGRLLPLTASATPWGRRGWGALLPLYAELDAIGQTAATFGFTADGSSLTSGDGPWETLLDVSATGTTAGALGGVKVCVNNAGYGEPSAVGRDIADADDGKVNSLGGQFSGLLDVQRRPNDSGAVLSVYDQATKVGAMLLAQGAGLAGGRVQALGVAGGAPLMLRETYRLFVDRPLYLPTTAAAAADLVHYSLLNEGPVTSLPTLLLPGGDATDDDAIDIADAGCIDGHFGQAPGICGVDGTSDVNGDGLVGILDLVLMGGNYGLSASLWTFGD
ncbi:MAG: hypothetical protein GX605_01895 [Chloroflexi bacterium]|nr:hypothetical protein [Chloroflexota bacterium]